MRHIVITTLAATLVAFAGCGSSDEGSGGGSGTGGTAGTGGGAAVALSFDETTSIPATAGSAAAMEAATRFGETLAAIFELANDAEASIGGASPKVLVPGFCTGGEADLVLPSGAITEWEGGQIVLTLTSCEGSVLSPSAVSGTVTIDVETVLVSSPDIRLDVMADVSLTGGANVTGTFAATAFVGIGGLALQLGKQLDDDDLRISDGNQDLTLGCFDIRVSLASNKSLTPLAVAKLDNRVYTINDYTQTPPTVFLDENGVPFGGTIVMNSGDNSAASPVRNGPCPGFGVAGMGPPITATFSEGGCIELSGAINQSTSWTKLLVGDLTPGGGPQCGGDLLCDPVEGAVELVDTEFVDSDWEITFVSQTEGSTVEQQATQQSSGGTDEGAFRQMTHVVGPTVGCPDERCGLVVYHQSSLTYDPGSEGAIAYVDYSEAQRMLESAFEGAAVGWAFFVEQNDTPYLALGEETAFTNTTWRTSSVCGITPESFTAPGLDFSENGGPITFGFTRSNTNTSTTSELRNVHGIDVFKVVIVKETPGQ